MRWFIICPANGRVRALRYTKYFSWQLCNIITHKFQSPTNQERIAWWLELAQVNSLVDKPGLRMYLFVFVSLCSAIYSKVFSCTLPSGAYLVAAIPLNGISFPSVRTHSPPCSSACPSAFVGGSIRILPSAQSAQCIPASRSDWKEKCSVTIGPTPFCTNFARIRRWYFDPITLSVSVLMVLSYHAPPVSSIGWTAEKHTRFS